MKHIFCAILILVSYINYGQCVQLYSWANYNQGTSTPTVADGVISVAGQSIKLTIQTNYDAGLLPSLQWTSKSGQIGITKICFAEYVKDPLISFSSLGGSSKVTLNFDTNYEVNFAGNRINYLSKTTISGNEGNGIIMFPGIHKCITITSTTREEYTFLYLGLPTPHFPILITGRPFGCEKVSLTASGGKTYVWSGGSNINNATNTIDSSGVYFVTASDGKGCQSTKSILVTILPKTIERSNLQKTICSGKSYLGHNKSGTYIDTLKTSLGCDSVRTLNLEVVDLKIEKFDNLKEICSGKNLELNPIITPLTLPIKYKWSTGDTLAKITTSKSGKYQLTIDNGVCIHKDSIIILDGLAPKLKDSDTLCVNVSPIVLDPEISENDLSFLWTPTNSTTKTIMTLKPGNFQVKVSTPAGCEAVRNFVVVPPPTIELGKDKSFCEEDSLELLPSITGLGRVNYQWSTGEITKSIKITKTGIYKLTVNQKECSVSDSVNVFSKNCVKILVPNAFSPNDDGVNDIFSINIFNAKALSLQIFDRLGNIIYFDENQNPKWNGKIQETLCLPGIYTFILTYNSPPDFSNKTYQGTVMVIY